MMIKIIINFLLVGSIASVGSVPFPAGKSVNSENFIGEGTNEIATALLQGYVHEDNNLVFSPLGYSAILAIFAEGARGESRQEIATALHFPDDVEVVRKAYHDVLERLAKRKTPNTPEFKNWFYIYKNYTVEEDLQNVLRKYYLTEVKSVDRPDDFVENEEKKKVTLQPPKEVEKESPITDVEIPPIAETVSKVDSEEAAANNEESLLDKQKDKPTKEKVKEKDCVEEEEVATVSEVKDKEIMIAMQRKGRSERSEDEDEVTEKFRLDHFSGMTDSNMKIKGKTGPLSQMIIFNGLYYRGDWEVPFVKKPAHDSRVFYKSENEKIFVSTIHSEGTFNSGNIQSLDCRAIELPYKGGRYSMLVLLPNSRNGLTKLVSDLSGYPIRKIFEQMTQKSLEVCLPTFEISTISKPISSFSRLGLSNVTSIFDPEKADLSGVSKEDPGLYVEELVQMVTFKVDADFSEANFLTASLASSRSEFEKFQINHPFLFYLRDNIENIVIVNGKLIDPTPEPDFFES